MDGMVELDLMAKYLTRYSHGWDDLGVWAVFNSAVGGLARGIQEEDLCLDVGHCFWEFIAKALLLFQIFYCRYHIVVVGIRCSMF